MSGNADASASIVAGAVSAVALTATESKTAATVDPDDSIPRAKAPAGS
jgi:hypothetical protein